VLTSQGWHGEDGTGKGKSGQRAHREDILDIESTCLSAAVALSIAVRPPRQLDFAGRRVISAAMTHIILPGPDCTTMTEVRAGVDQVDRELIELLARRFAYMDAAARIKPERGHVRDEARKAQVIDNARAAARAAGIPEDAVTMLWDQLIEASIAYEFEAFDRR
jgi:isochorismate pyruvate lyase